MFDVHCHLADLRFETELENIIGGAAKTEVKMISCGTSPESNVKTVEIAQRFENVWACVGIHPEEIQNPNNKFADLKDLLKQPKVVGVGEVGLDYRFETGEKDKKAQKKLFESQLELAEEFKLPVQVHNRSADEDILMLIDKYRVSGVMHCFTRNIAFMEECIHRGWWISFGGLLTYENNIRMRKAAAVVPENKLLLETDSPYSLPKPLTGKTNEPGNIWIIAETVAKLRQTSPNQLAKTTCDNAAKVFNIKI